MTRPEVNKGKETAGYAFVADAVGGGLQRRQGAINRRSIGIGFEAAETGGSASAMARLRIHCLRA